MTDTDSRRTLAFASVLLLALALAATVGGATEAQSASPADVGAVASAPTAQLTLSPDPAKVGDVVTLDASGSTAPTGVDRCDFDVGNDGSWEYSETDCVATHTFSTAGDHAVKVLVIEGDFSDTATKTVTVDPNQPPTASFSYSPTSPQPYETVTFDGTASSDSDGSIVSAVWTIDGSVVAEAPTFDHEFTAEGTYEVTLVVRDDDGAEDQVTKTVTVAYPDPVARCSVSPTSVAPGETVTIDATNTENAVYVDFDVDGDGTYDQGREVEFVVTTSYAEAGTYTPRVEASYAGSTDTADCGTVTVATDQPPTASFTYSPSSPETGETVTFDASASSDPDGSIVEYRWDFDGDGTVDRTTANPVTSFSFDSAGTHLVTLRVVDDDGLTGMDEANVGAADPVTARCSVSPTAVRPGETVTIDASDTENAGYVTYDLDGDGTDDDGREVDFVYETSYDTAGTYTPTVTAHAGGRTDVAECGTVTVSENAPPTASLTHSPSSPKTGETVTFDASASSDPDGTIVEYRWDFDGDGTVDQTTTGPSTTHAYQQGSSFVATVTVVDDEGATATASTDVPVERPPPAAACTVDPTDAAVGETVTIDASDTENAVYVEFDLDGDGTYDDAREVDFVYETSYETAGTYTPTVRVHAGDRTDVAECGTVTVGGNEPPTASFTTSPANPSAGETVTFDASASSDPDGTIVEYHWDFDGDGTVDRVTKDPTTTYEYDPSADLRPVLTVYDDSGQEANATRSFDDPGAGTTAMCSVSPTSVAVGETVEIDASESDAAYVRVDVDGDGTFDTSDETDFVVSTTYDEPGEYTPRVEVRQGDASNVVECDVVTVTDEDEGGIPPIPPWAPLVPGGLGAGYLLYRFFPRGGGSPTPPSDTGQKTPKPKPKPKPKKSHGPRYDAGTFLVPRTSDTVAVEGVGFEPDVVLFSATNAARADGATDRTAGWTLGAAVAEEDGFTQQAVTVADDAASTDQGTCATVDGAGFDLVRHDDRLPGRVRGRIARTTDDGFEVDVSVPGADPAAGGIRVFYRAFRVASDVEVSVGHFTTATEPGVQSVPLDVDADHVTLVGSSAVDGFDRTWTTDRAVGLSVGTAVGRESVTQTVWNGTAWPGAEHHRAAAGSVDHALSLLYLDGDGVAGRTTASVVGLGEELRLRYDRAYSGPHKLGSTDPHVVGYVAMDTGDSMRPAVGAVPMPAPGESVAVDCGFDPGMVELTTCGVDALGATDPTAATAAPFGWSHGAAVTRDGSLYQYALHGSTSPTGGGLPGAPARSTAVTDGGLADPVPDAVPAEAPERTATPVEARVDDGVAAAWLPTDATGAIVGRDELAVSAFTPAGFEVAVRGVRADDVPTSRPLVFYRAWPRGGGDAGGDGAGTAGSSDSANAAPASQNANESPEFTGFSEGDSR